MHRRLGQQCLRKCCLLAVHFGTLGAFAQDVRKRNHLLQCGEKLFPLLESQKQGLISRDAVFATKCARQSHTICFSSAIRRSTTSFFKNNNGFLSVISQYEGRWQARHSVALNLRSRCSCVESETQTHVLTFGCDEFVLCIRASWLSFGICCTSQEKEKLARENRKCLIQQIFNAVLVL